MIGASIGIAGIWFGKMDVIGSVFVWFFPALFLAVVLHELGHLAASVAAGLQFRQFAAGPLVVTREARGLRVRLVMTGCLVGGQVQAIPTSVAGVRRKFLIFTAGGPVATALLFLAIANLPPTSFSSALWLANLIVAAGSWIPHYAGGFASDGKCLQLLRRPSPEGELLTALLYVLALDTQGVPPREWDADTVQKLRLPGPAPLAGTAAIFLMNHDWHRDDPEEFADAVEGALALVPVLSPDLRRYCFDAASWAQSFGRGNVSLAEAWLADARAVKGAVPSPDWDASSAAAIELAKGNVAGARDGLTSAIAALDRRPGASGSVLACRRRFVELLDQLAPLGRA
jgi:hypothetical protein